MFMLGLTVFAFSLCARRIVAATDSSTAAPVDITNNVLELSVLDKFPGQRTWSPRLAPSQQPLLGVHQNRFYLAHVIVGGQLLNLSVEISSHTTWVASSKFTCLNPYNVPQPQSICRLSYLFESAASQTLLPTYQRVKQDYLDGQFIEGHIVQEKLNLGGFNEKKEPFFSITQNILLAEKGYWKGDGISSGVLGLAFPSMPGSVGVIETLLQQDSILDPIFSLALFRYTPDLPDSGGIIAFGGIPNIYTDQRWATTAILAPFSGSTAPCIKVAGFSILPDGFKRTKARYSSYPKVMAIASGIPQLYVPAEVVDFFARHFDPIAQLNPEKNQYFVRCDAKSPSFGIRIENRPYYISKNDLLSPAPEYGDNMCILLLQPVSGDGLVLGDAWLKSVLVVFDYSNRNEESVTPNGVLRVAGRKS